MPWFLSDLKVYGYLQNCKPMMPSSVGVSLNGKPTQYRQSRLFGASLSQCRYAALNAVPVDVRDDVSLYQSSQESECAAAK